MPPRAHRPRGGPARLGHRPPDALWQRAARPASHGGHAWVSTAATGPCSPAASPTPVYADFSGGGIPAATISRADLVALVSTALSEFTATQRIIQRRSWEYGNTSAVAEAIARSQAQTSA